jgi:hypothetical protein
LEPTEVGCYENCMSEEVIHYVLDGVVVDTSSI